MSSAAVMIGALRVKVSIVCCFNWHRFFVNLSFSRQKKKEKEKKRNNNQSKMEYYLCILETNY